MGLRVGVAEVGVGDGASGVTVGSAGGAVTAACPLALADGRGLVCRCRRGRCGAGADDAALLPPVSGAWVEDTDAG